MSAILPGISALCGMVLCFNSGHAADDSLVDTSPLPTQLDQSEHGQIFDEAVHILGGNVNVISQWTGPIRLVVVGDAGVDGQSVNTREAAATGTEHQSSGAEYARSVIAEIAALTRLQVAQSKDAYVNADDYLESINRADRFSLSDCSNESGSNESGSDESGSDQEPAVESNPDTTPTADSAGEAAQCGNFFVVFADVEKMAAIAKAIPLRPVYQKAFESPDAIKCFFSPFQTGYMEIRQALVFVRSDLSGAMVRTCLQEEIYQSFGMFNDYTGSRYYSFNNKIEPKVITRYDRALLQTIYDSSFRQGAPVFMVVKKLMTRLGLDPFTDEK